MAKKKKKSGAAAAKAGAARAAQAPPADGADGAAAPPAAASLGTRRATKRPEKVSAKEQSAIAKKAARAKWDERMTGEGR
jgi:hypothetical protein